MTLQRRKPTEIEAIALRELDSRLEAELFEWDGIEEIASMAQSLVYEIGKKLFGQEALRDWFKALYETLLGSSQGPRMGSFIALYGVANTRKLIGEALGD